MKLQDVVNTKTAFKYFHMRPSWVRAWKILMKKYIFIRQRRGLIGGCAFCWMVGVLKAEGYYSEVKETCNEGICPIYKECRIEGGRLKPIEEVIQKIQDVKKRVFDWHKLRLMRLSREYVRRSHD